MPESKFFDVKVFWCFFRHMLMYFVSPLFMKRKIDAQNHELQTHDLHQSNDDQSLDGANRSPLGTPTDDGVPLPSMNNQLQFQTSGEPKSAVVEVEKETVPGLPRKRMADGERENIGSKLKRLKNANTYLENECVLLKKQCAWLEKSVENQKEIAANWKDKYNGQTNMVAELSTALLTKANRSDQNEIQLLRQRILQLEARNEQLENEINARAQVNNKESEQGIGSSQN